MNWFSRKELSEKVSALEKENDDLRADLTASQEEASKVPELTQEIAGLKEDIESLKSELAIATESLEAAKKEAEESRKPESIVSAIESAAASEEESPIKEALAKHVALAVAGTGHPPLDTFKAEEEEGKSLKMAREAFNNLKITERNEFIRKGGNSSTNLQTKQ